MKFDKRMMSIVAVSERSARRLDFHANLTLSAVVDEISLKMLRSPRLNEIVGARETTNGHLESPRKTLSMMLDRRCRLITRHVAINTDRIGLIYH
jgi:hypothetical protein